MKTFRLRSHVLASILAALALLPVRSGLAAFVLESTEVSNGHAAVQFNDTNAQAFWLLHNSAPGFTAAFSAFTNGWEADVVPHGDGNSTIIWNNPDANQIAFWRFGPSGTLMSAATYSFDEGNPWILNGATPLGQRLLISFLAAPGSAAVWLVGPGGSVDAVLGWAAPALANFPDGEYGDFRFLAGSLINPVKTDGDNFFVVDFLIGNAYTIYTFDAAGNWIGASSYGV